MTQERIQSESISDTNDKNYALDVRLKVMDESLKGFLDEFDLDLFVVSLVYALKSKGNRIKENEDLKILFLNLSQSIDKLY